MPIALFGIHGIHAYIVSRYIYRWIHVTHNFIYIYIYLYVCEVSFFGVSIYTYNYERENKEKRFLKNGIEYFIILIKYIFSDRYI